MPRAQIGLVIKEPMKFSTINKKKKRRKVIWRNLNVKYIRKILRRFPLEKKI